MIDLISMREFSFNLLTSKPVRQSLVKFTNIIIDLFYSTLNKYKQRGMS